MTEFTQAILYFWRTNRKKFPSWAAAAKMVFTFVPSSAASEHIFALVKNLFGPDRHTTLADCVQVALMLNYDRRLIG